MIMTMQTFTVDGLFFIYNGIKRELLHFIWLLHPFRFMGPTEFYGWYSNKTVKIINLPLAILAALK